MAIVTIPDEQKVLCDESVIRRHLETIGITYERWEPTQSLSDHARAEEILAAYEPEIERLKARGGYVAADVIDVDPGTAGLEQMLAKFKREHWHAEDEVRFITRGRGIFHIRPVAGPVTAIVVEPGDLLSVPQQTLHWFDLCEERRIQAIRLFQDPQGWTPYYTESTSEARYQPLCLGPSYRPLQNDSN